MQVVPVPGGQGATLFVPPPPLSTCSAVGSTVNPTLLYSLQLILQTSYSCHANQIILSKTCIDTCEAISRAIGRLTNGLPRSTNKTKILVNRSALFQPAQMVWLEVILQVSKSYRYYLKGCSRKDPIKLSPPTKEISAI